MGGWMGRGHCWTPRLPSGPSSQLVPQEDPVEVAGQLEQLELQVGELYAERDLLREKLAAEVCLLPVPLP